MARLMYGEAREQILETTEMGYTLASQDRLWIVFTFDVDSEDACRYGRLYFITPNLLAYDLCEREIVFTSRGEAEDFARGQRLTRMERYRKWLLDGHEPFVLPDVYVMNLGDDARYENAILGHLSPVTRSAPKYKGSTRAWNASIEYRIRANEWYDSLPDHD